LRTVGSLIARGVAEARRQWPVVRFGLVRVTRLCESALESFVAATRSLSALMWGGLLQIRRALGGSMARLASEVRSRRHLPRAHLVRVQRKSRSVSAGL